MKRLPTTRSTHKRLHGGEARAERRNAIDMHSMVMGTISMPTSSFFSLALLRLTRTRTRRHRRLLMLYRDGVLEFSFKL